MAALAIVLAVVDGDVAAGVHLSGLIDSKGLDACNYDAQRSGLKAERSAPGRVAVGMRSGVGQAAKPADKPALARVWPESAQSPDG